MYVNELVRVAAENIGQGEAPPLAVLPAAIPYFSVRLSALCVEKRELDVLQEFILRAIALGLCEDASIAGFLGTAHEEVASGIKTLRGEYFVGRKGDVGPYMLTEKGMTAISQEGLRRVVERETACYVSGVTRGVEQVSETLAPRRRVPDGTIFLPAVPSRPPRVNELDIAGIRATMMAARTQLPRVLEITRLGRIVRTSSLFSSGYLILRRGTESGPVICAHGAQNSELARILGGHPAIEIVRNALESDEKRARNLLRRHVRELNVKLATPDAVRGTLAAALAYLNAESSEGDQRKGDFLKSAESLIDRTYWIGEVEWHLLFAKLTAEVADRLLIVAPPFGPLFGLEQLEMLAEVASRDVEVEWLMSEEQRRLFERDERIKLSIDRIKISTSPVTGEGCGICSDRARVVLAMTRENVTASGHYASLFGIYAASAQGPETLLRAFAASTGWEVQPATSGERL